MTETTRKIAPARSRAQSGKRRKSSCPRRKPSRSRRLALLARLWRAAERQVDEIEARLEGELRETGERERDARVLAIIVKTLRELAAFDAAAREKANARGKITDDDDPFPRNIDDLRRELARRIEILCAERKNSGVSGGARLS